MDIDHTPSTEQAIEAARILGLYFVNAESSHAQLDEQKPLAAFAQAHAEADAVYGNPSANMRELGSLTYLQEQMQFLIEDIVERARVAGESWANIGDQFNISRQAAQQRFGASPAKEIL